MRGGADALKMIRYAAFAAHEVPRLSDPPRRRSYKGGRELLGWALTGTLVIAGSSYWIGLESVGERGAADQSTTGTGQKRTVRPAQPSEAQPSHSDVRSTRISSSEPTVGAPVPGLGAPIHEQKKALGPNEQIQGAEAATIRELAAKTPEKSGERAADSDGIWPVQMIEGASGRLIRIGNFTTASEAAKGWETVIRQYPGMQRLPVLPVPIKSLRDGHIYYRLQVGTTSQAHSEVVCDRMRNMNQSCAVIGSDQASGESAI